MYELPGDVFVCGQLLPAQLQSLSDHGIQGIINNRLENEAPLQPTSESMGQAAQALSLEYQYIPMLGGLSSELIEASVSAYENTPRPIVTFCASGMRSAALWAFAHVKAMGVDAVIKALEDSPYNLMQIYPLLKEYELEGKGSN